MRAWWGGPAGSGGWSMAGRPARSACGIRWRPLVGPTAARRGGGGVGRGGDARGKRLVSPTVDVFAEGVVYREFFPRGLTALDDLTEETLGLRPTSSHVTARDEVKILIDALRLPIDERGKRRAAAR